MGYLGTELILTIPEVSLLTKLIEKSRYVVKDKYSVSAAATENEAYQVKEILDDNSYSKETFKLINSGTIDLVINTIRKNINKQTIGTNLPSSCFLYFNDI